VALFGEMGFMELNKMMMMNGYWKQFCPELLTNSGGYEKTSEDAKGQPIQLMNWTWKSALKMCIN
jgi:hypothetical protein